MVTKKNTLIISSLITIFVAFLSTLGIDSCYENSTCHTLQNTFSSDFLLVAFVFPPILLLSLLTYRMRDEVFRAWWNFARWLVPIIILATILIQFMPNNRGFFNMDALIYLLVLAPLYTVLILGSLWKIFRTYRAMKNAS